MSPPLTLAEHAPAVKEYLEDTEYSTPPSNDAGRDQPSAAVDEPVAADAPHTESCPQGPRWVEAMQPGTMSYKRGYAEMKGILEGTTEDSEVEEGNHQWKRPRATMDTPRNYRYVST